MNKLCNLSSGNSNEIEPNSSLQTYFSKRLNLLVFSKLLNYYNTHFVVKKQVYSNIQPSKSFGKKIFKFLFFDNMIDLLPHSSNGQMFDFSLTSRAMFSTVIGRLWPSSMYKFIDETNYFDTMKSVNFGVEKSNSSDPEFAKNFFDDSIDKYIGYGLITTIIEDGKPIYVIDTRYLTKFETRNGYSDLDIIIYLDNCLHFDYCIIKGQTNDKRKDDLAIRECITAIFTIITIEKHLFNIHFLLSDQFNTLLNTITDKTNPIYRILIPITYKPFGVNEAASIVLLGHTGVCSWFNFTRKGLTQYYNYAKDNLKIRDFLVPSKFKGDSSINQHQNMWYDCIHNFVKEFMAENIRNNNKFLSSDDKTSNDFINLLKTNYVDIYNEKTTKLSNIIDICTMIIYFNIVHEIYSNSKSSKLSMNPFTISTTWKHNDSKEIVDKINNLGEQTLVNFIAYITSLEAIRLDDERWVDMCCTIQNQNETQIYQNFRTAISELGKIIPLDAILHPNNISSSVSY
jgi:hypothetical protein